MTESAVERVDLVQWLKQPDALTEKLAGAKTIVLRHACLCGQASLLRCVIALTRTARALAASGFTPWRTWGCMRARSCAICSAW